MNLYVINVGANMAKKKSGKSKVDESYMAQEKRLMAERQAKWKEEQAAKLNEGSEVSKALFRLMELKETLAEADAATIESCFVVTDAFERETEIRLSELLSLFDTIVKAMEPQQSVATGTTSLYDEFEVAKKENENLKEMAAELADYLPLDRYHQEQLSNDIWNKGGTSYATYNLPLFMDQSFALLH